MGHAHCPGGIWGVYLDFSPSVAGRIAMNDVSGGYLSFFTAISKDQKIYITRFGGSSETSDDRSLYFVYARGGV
jgi:hypothetical protein